MKQNEPKWRATIMVAATLASIGATIALPSGVVEEAAASCIGWGVTRAGVEDCIGAQLQTGGRTCVGSGRDGENNTDCKGVYV
jgi:hypothetical protein